MLLFVIIIAVGKLSRKIALITGAILSRMRGDHSNEFASSARLLR